LGPDNFQKEGIGTAGHECSGGDELLAVEHENAVLSCSASAVTLKTAFA
jgi:hypothetical protein